MSPIKKMSAAALLCAACVATVAQAAPVLTIVPVYDRTYTVDGDGNIVDLGALDLSNVANAGADKFHKVDIRFMLEGIGATDDFANLAFDLNLGAGLTPVDLGGGNYIPTNLTFTLGLGTANYYVNNGDGGADAGDLKAIFANATAVAARNRKHGETGRPADAAGMPTILGSVVLSWDGTAAKVTASPAPGAFVSIFPNNTSGAPNPVALTDAQFMTGEVAFGGSVVEPKFVAVVSAEPGSPTAQPVTFTGSSLYQPPVEIAGGPKSAFEIGFTDIPVTPAGDMFVAFWLNGTPEDIAALKAEFEAEATNGVLLASGPMFDELMRVYPTSNMILQYPGQAPVLDGGNLVVDFSNTGVTVSAIAAVPEPASLLSLGALGVLGMLRRRR